MSFLPASRRSLDLEFDNHKRRSRMLMALGLVLALVAGGGAYYAVNIARQSAGVATARVPVVIAIETIRAREPIEADQVAMQEVALDDANRVGVASDVNQVVGRVPAVAILKGQMVTSNMLASTTAAGYSILAPDETISPDSEHWRAIALTAPDDLALGGTLQAGQTVDIFVTAVVAPPEELTEDGEYFTDRTTKVVYQNALILAREDAFYIIRASLAVAEEIAHLQASGNATFSFALRPDVDTRLADATDLGQTLNRIVERYGLPLAEPLDGAPSGSGRPSPTPSPTPSPEPSPDASEAPDDGASPAPDASASPAP
jgi:Flp pilus assembly protein CpaB